MKWYIWILMGCLIFTGCSRTKYTIIEEDIANKEQTLDESQSEVESIEIPITMKKVDYSEYFRGVQGCMVIYDPSQNSYDLYNQELCEKRVSPYSTFKVVSTLMALDKQLTDDRLEEAFRKSDVPYYEKLIDLLDKEYVQEILESLEYGNEDISIWEEEHGTFWINSTLEISPLEQVQVLEKIFNEENLFKREHIQVLEELMLVDTNGDYTIYGKTGSAKRKDAWFIGVIKKQDTRRYFAVKVEDDTQEFAGRVAKEIGINILEQHYMLKLQTSSK